MWGEIYFIVSYIYRAYQFPQIYPVHTLFKKKKYYFFSDISENIYCQMNLLCLWTISNFLHFRYRAQNKKSFLNEKLKFWKKTKIRNFCVFWFDVCYCRKGRYLDPSLLLCFFCITNFFLLNSLEIWVDFLRKVLVSNVFLLSKALFIYFSNILNRLATHLKQIKKFNDSII